jgi:carotenoid cleavage dioxygenase-like enzyme
MNNIAVTEPSQHVDNPYLDSGNFAPLKNETTTTELRTRGQIPRDLQGRALRIGPSPIAAPDPALYHWFTGTGLVHGIRLRDGRAEWYRSRFTSSTDAIESLGKPKITGPGMEYMAVNTNVLSVGGRLFAIVESGAYPIELDYELNSIARSDFGGTLEAGFTAHPKGDPVTGELVAITYDWQQPTLRYVTVDTAGRAQTRAEIPTPHKPMVHDCGLTQNFVIVLDLPVTFQPERHPGHPFPYFWDNARTGRVGLLPRDGDVSRLTWFDVPPCFVFHIINAYETDNEQVIVDVIRHPRSFDRRRLWPDEGQPHLARWTLDRRDGTFSERMLDARPGEFPRINDRRSGLPYRYAYTAHWWGDRLSTAPAYKHDVVDNRTEVHDFGRGCATMEPMFVERRGAQSEDDGYLLCVVYNANRDASELVILSAQDFTGPPLAVVELPVRVPFGFHGGFIPDEPAGS